VGECRLVCPVGWLSKLILDYDKASILGATHLPPASWVIVDVGLQLTSVTNFIDKSNFHLPVPTGFAGQRVAVVHSAFCFAPFFYPAIQQRFRFAAGSLCGRNYNEHIVNQYNTTILKRVIDNLTTFSRLCAFYAGVEALRIITFCSHFTVLFDVFHGLRTYAE
jgi:hypothetical protein